MQYLITLEDTEPFLTKWFEAENNFIAGMTVYDLINHCYTADGIIWLKIELDHL
jgi:hypothetical protein